MADPVIVIQATLAPIFLVSGAAIFLNFTQARLFRVVDRVRASDVNRRRNLRRAVLLRNAILLGVLVIGFTVATTLLLLAPNLVPGSEWGNWPIYTFAAALVCFAAALVLVSVDAVLSVAAVRYQAEEFGKSGA